LGGGGGGGGAGGGGAAGGGQPAFADAAAARAFLKDYVPAEDYIKPFDDAKIMPFAAHLKTKVDGFGKQFPEGWRQLIAGDNAEHMKTLERFQSPKALYESYGALRAKMASGELKPVTPFPDKGTADEQNAWRAANGVPLAAEEYIKTLKLPDGVVLGDDDKTVVDGFAKSAHAAHMPPAHVNATVAWYLQEKEARAAARAEAEDQRRMQTEDALRSEWGPDYRGNVGRVKALLEGLPKELAEGLSGARLADGSMVMNNPHALKWLVDVSRQFNPAGVVLPGSGGTQIQSVEEEIKGIEKVMREDRGTYNKDEKKQQRYRDLLSAYEKMAGHAWGSKKAA
jgi:hypothetical protein